MVTRKTRDTSRKFMIFTILILVNIKVVDSEALAGVMRVVLGSEYWSSVACVGDSAAGEFRDIETYLYY